MENVLVSICMPAYNSSTFIGETLDSIRRQTYQNWELIIADDASTDGTKEIVEEFGRQVTQKVSYVRNKKNLGVAATRNVAAGNSNGQWLALMDSDDLWHPDHLHTLVSTSIACPDCDLIHSAANVFDSQTGKIIFRQFLADETIKQFPVSLFDGSYNVQTCSAMISRKLYESTGGSDDNFKYSDDLELWFRCARIGFKFAFTGKETCYYRKHPGGLSSHPLQMILDTARVYDMNADWEMIPKKTRFKHASLAWLSVARMARRKNMALAKDSLSRSMKYDFTLKHLAYWIFFRVPVFNNLKRTNIL
ncbi:MAG TPA: glycosyltransferase [Chitinophagaceae bacterium]|nr:glycosyltransferase [Chitinophagaceae bacterium]